MNETEEKHKDRQIMIWGLLTVILIIGLWFLTIYLLKDDVNRGTFGDMFGSINALFSGLALAGIIFTILLQRLELSYQRNELRETRKEFIIQNKTLKIQRFENTFFNLLGLHHKIIEGIDYDNQIVKKDGRGWSKVNEKREYAVIAVKGRDVFKDKFEILSDKLLRSKKSFNEEYLEYYETLQTDFGHYFRNLYRIIKFVNEAEFSSNEEIGIPLEPKKYKDLIAHEVTNFSDRYKYISMVRAQLADYELLWIFYNCLSEKGNEKFKPLIEKYSLLKNLPRNRIQDKRKLEEYAESAYNKK